MEINEPGLLAECAARLNKPEEAVHYLEILVRDYGIKFDSIKKGPIYKDIQNTKSWKKLERKSKKYYDANREKILEKSLHFLIIRDWM